MNQKGQAAIFVALMFNVLFVFFAMAINIALVVHDKINLQNSVDLAAYYAASKQAEILNVMAHQNYQIRQSWKLLTWRYRTLGTMGLYRGISHPVRTGELSNTVYPPAVKPSLCVSYKPNWKEVPDGENLCNTENLKIPPLPEVPLIAGFIGANFAIRALSQQLRSQFDLQCEKLGAANWWFAMSILHAFRLDQRNRKQIIFALAQNLSGGQNGDFTDLDGNSVLEGARQTLLKNLTFANRQSLEGGNGELKLLNSLEGVDVRSWLPEVKIAPTVIYTDVDNQEGCYASPQPVENLPQRPGAVAQLRAPFPQGYDAEKLEPWRTAVSIGESDYQYSIGVEKNPWYMAYMGVKVTTRPRQIFFPFGSGIELSAKGFAKPFGGRMGPWYQSQWDRGAQTSTGGKTDPLMAPRLNQGGLLNSKDDPTRLPNYSRYPGDALGLSSKLALNAINGLKTVVISYDYYKNIKAEFDSGTTNDILPWDFSGNSAPKIRDYEIAALAPDLFDITYYSIEPNFEKNYLARLRANRANLRIPSTTPLRADLGHSNLAPGFTVQEQMQQSKAQNYQRPEAFSFVREKSHLLTAWLPGPGPFNYDVPDSMNNFGKCALPDDNLKVTTPGSCAAGGGRTGYSVKLISLSALTSSQHKIGGEGAGPGAIMNPPPEDW